VIVVPEQAATGLVCAKHSSINWVKACLILGVTGVTGVVTMVGATVAVPRGKYDKTPIQ